MSRERKWEGRASETAATRKPEEVRIYKEVLEKAQKSKNVLDQKERNLVNTEKELNTEYNRQQRYRESDQ